MKDNFKNELYKNLNKFQRQETLRQIEFKQNRWPGLPDGVWSKDKSRTYPHILPEVDYLKVFYPPIADNVFAFCKNNEIAIHSEVCNLRSSQVSCFNVMFPLKEDFDLAAKVLEPLLPGVKEVTEIDFEFTGGDKATTWLGEPSGGKRGQNRTSIDVAIKWRDSQRKLITLIEWKYTEQSFGECGGYRSKSNNKKNICREMDITSSNYIDSCYLTKGTSVLLKRNYWNLLEEAGINFGKLHGVDGCPFRGPFYQLMRQYLLVAYLKENSVADEVYVALLSFRGNSSLNNIRQHLKNQGSTVIEAWNSILSNVPKLRHVEVETIVDNVRKANQGKYDDWLEYLNERYGI